MKDGAEPAIRDPLYVERRLDVEHRTDGSIILFNPTPYSEAFQTTNAALDHWRRPRRRRADLAGRTFGRGLAQAELWRGA